MVNPDRLRQKITENNVVVVDGSWHLPPEKRDARAEYIHAHIPGAIFFDLDEHSDAKSDLPHMLPDVYTFGRQMGALGISHENEIIVYDTLGLFSAARVWWMFKQFGARQVCVLDGGFPAWQKAGLPIDGGIVSRPATDFDAKPVLQDKVVTLDEILQGLRREETPLILDARGAGRFYAREEEPRPGMRGGHIPGAVNLPYRSLLNEDMTMKSREDLVNIFAEIGYSPAAPAIASCGSGVTACIIALALSHIGYPDIPIYDGSWSEWGSLGDTPVETE